MPLTPPWCRDDSPDNSRKTRHSPQDMIGREPCNTVDTPLDHTLNPSSPVPFAHHNDNASFPLNRAQPIPYSHTPLSSVHQPNHTGDSNVKSSDNDDTRDNKDNMENENNIANIDSGADSPTILSPPSPPNSKSSLEKILQQYSDKPELLQLILTSKVEEDRRRAEEARLRSKEIDYHLRLGQRATTSQTNADLGRQTTLDAKPKTDNHDREPDDSNASHLFSTPMNTSTATASTLSSPGWKPPSQERARPVLTLPPIHDFMSSSILHDPFKLTRTNSGYSGPTDFVGRTPLTDGFANATPPNSRSLHHYSQTLTSSINTYSSPRALPESPVPANPHTHSFNTVSSESRLDTRSGSVTMSSSKQLPFHAHSDSFSPSTSSGVISRSSANPAHSEQDISLTTAYNKPLITSKTDTSPLNPRERTQPYSAIATSSQSNSSKQAYSHYQVPLSQAWLSQKAHKDDQDPSSRNDVPLTSHSLEHTMPNKLPIPPNPHSSSSATTSTSERLKTHAKRRRREMQAITMIIETREFPYNDNYLWKNNGNTIHKESGNRSIYYKCANNNKGCPVNKTVSFKENGEYLIKYRGKHLNECHRIMNAEDDKS